MNGILRNFWIVAGPTEAGVRFFLGRRDWCTFHVRRKGSKEIRSLRLRLIVIEAQTVDRLLIFCLHPYRPGWTIRVNVHARTGQGYIPWFADAFGTVDPWSHLPLFIPKEAS